MGATAAVTGGHDRYPRKIKPENKCYIFVIFVLANMLQYQMTLLIWGFLMKL